MLDQLATLCISGSGVGRSFRTATPPPHRVFHCVGAQRAPVQVGVGLALRVQPERRQRRDPEPHLGMGGTRVIQTKNQTTPGIFIWVITNAIYYKAGSE